MTPTQQYFKDIHDHIQNNYINKDLQTEINEAAILDDFFKDIKILTNPYVIKHEDKNPGDLRKTLSVITQQAFQDSLKKNLERALGSTATNLFIKKGGIQGEQDVATAIFAFMKTVIQNFSDTPKAFPKNKSKSRMMTGKETANINLTTEVEEQVKGFMGHFKDYLDKLPKATNNNNVKRYIKIDVEPAKVFNKKDILFQIEVEEDDQLVRIFQILQKSRISVKNYAYNGFSSIHLGNSSLTKVFGGIASGIKVNFTTGLNDVNAKNKNEFAQHIYHMRFLYELTGIGLGNGKPVNFLVFNTHGDATSIEVRSVKEIVNDVFNSRLGENYINNEIGIPKEYFRGQEKIKKVDKTKKF